MSDADQDFSRYANVGDLAKDMIECVQDLHRSRFPWHAPIQLCEQAVLAAAALAGSVLSGAGLVGGHGWMRPGLRIALQPKSLPDAWGKLSALCDAAVGAMPCCAHSEARRNAALQALAALDPVWAAGWQMLRDHYEGENVL